MSKTLAAILLGLTLAAALCGIFAALLPVSLQAQIVWAATLLFPVWVCVTSAAFLFRSGKTAWLGLGLANLVAFALLYGLKFIGWLDLGSA